MATSKKEPKQPQTPPINVSNHETKLAALALRSAEKQLASGTASSQIISHFLKKTDPHRESLEVEKLSLEVERLRLENELTAKKIDTMGHSQMTEELFSQVMDALKTYTVSNNE